MQWIPLLLAVISPYFSLSKMQELSTEIEKLPTYSYPYPKLTETLKHQSKASLLLFAYGSLLDPNSASRHLSWDAIDARKAALAFGVKRMFNRNVLEAGVLNIQKTGQLTDFINGVLIEIPLTDIASLLQREVGYDLIPVLTVEWDSFLKGPPDYKIAYILSSPSHSSYVSSSISPHKPYYALVRNAAYSYGPLFALLWYKTTFLADGETPVELWEKRSLTP